MNGCTGPAGPTATTPFVPVFNGPSEDPFNHIGFIQEHARGFAAFDGRKIFLDVFKDENSACNGILFDCLDDRPWTNGGLQTLQLPEAPNLDPDTNIQDVIGITELEPAARHFFAGKQIEYDGTITEHPRVAKWWQRVARVIATIPHVFDYMCEARERNICLIRGAPANLDRQPTRNWIAGRDNRGDHGFLDKPTRLEWYDIDGALIAWQADPEAAIRTLVTMLGEPWASTSFVWFFSATHGLERDEHKRWTGRIVDGSLRCRIGFVPERELNQAEARALNSIARARVPEVDRRGGLITQLNYIRRPLWKEHPGRDVLGDIPTIGWVKGKHERLTVPPNLDHKAKWAGPQGHDTNIADHPNAESAVRSIGCEGEVRAHVMAAVRHLLRANPIPEGTSSDGHSLDIIAKLRNMIAQHREEISNNLVRKGRSEHVVDELLQHTKPAWAKWLLDRPNALHRKTIKLVKDARAQPEEPQATAEEIFARVERTVEYALHEALTSSVMAKRAELEQQLAELKGPAADVQQRMMNRRARERLRKQLADLRPPVILSAGPPGSRKSTLARRAALRYLRKHPNKTVIFAVHMHKLGTEQLDDLYREHPNGGFKAAIWRGRHADDPLMIPDPKRHGKFLKMCQREVDALMAEDVMVDPDRLCIQGRGKNAIKCPLYDNCAYQRQNLLKGINVWFVAHECLAHETPKILGDVGWVIVDESPLDAFMFGVDKNKPITIGLDTLRMPLRVADEAKITGSYGVPRYAELMEARKKLYHALDIPLSDNLSQGAPVPRGNLTPFASTLLDRDERGMYLFHGGEINPIEMRNLTLAGKFNPDIRPDMSTDQLKIALSYAADNYAIKMEVKLWETIAAMKSDLYLLRHESLPGPAFYGRIQIERGEKGRDIRMTGLETVKTGWDVPTLALDATADAELLKAIWPQLEEPEPHGRQQLPRPASVRVFQLADRAMSKERVGVKAQDPKKSKKKTDKKTDPAYGARRAYSAVLAKALEYEGQPVGVIIDKSAREWIEKNCQVPKWLTILHWGSHLGTNLLRKVRALFVVGRWQAPPEAVVRQAEALFGGYIAERDYRERYKGGLIRIVPDPDGNNAILVDVWDHTHPMVERLRWQITMGSLLQAIERARSGLRTDGEPLDLHIWTNVPVPEMGPVVPVLWSGVDAGLDGLMLAMGGCWLQNSADAVRAFRGLLTADGRELFTADGIRKARSVGAGVEQDGEGRVTTFPFWTRGVCTGPIDSPIGPVHTPVIRALYQRASPGCKRTEAWFLREVADPRGWLEQRLGSLAYFAVETDEQLSARPLSLVVSERETKIQDCVTKIQDCDTTSTCVDGCETKGRGRRPIGRKALSNVERQRRWRARRKLNGRKK